jgi:hypothetical protein
MNRFRSFIVDVLTSIVTNIFWILLTAAWALIIAAINSLFEYLESRNFGTLTYCILTAIVISAAFLSAWLIGRNANKFKPRFPSIKFDFELLLLVVELEFITRESILYKIKYYIRANDRVDEFKTKIIWTGNLLEPPEFTYNPRCNILSPVAEEEDGQHYSIRFLPPIYRGEEARFDIQYACKDDAHKMNPHLSFRIKWPTKRLVLRVVTRENLLTNVRRCVYPEDNGELPLDKIMPSQPKVENSYTVYEWNVKRPHLFFYYRFDWEFKKAKKRHGCCFIRQKIVNNRLMNRKEMQKMSTRTKGD